MKDKEYVQMIRAIAAGLNAIADFEENGNTESMMKWVEQYSSKINGWVSDIETDSDSKYMVNMIDEARKRMMN